MREALARVDGVKDVVVVFDEQRATVRYDPRVTNVRALIKVIEKLGFKAWPISSEKKRKPKRRSTTSP